MGRRLLKDAFFRSIVTATFSMGWNLIYALFNAVLALVYLSYWYLSLFVYYVLLGSMRLYVVIGKTKLNHSVAHITKWCGIGMVCLSVTLAGIMSMIISDDRNPSYNTIVMITIATFTFYIMTLAIISAVKARRHKNSRWILLRDIALAGAIGSMVSLERAMLGTFGDATDDSSTIMEIISGAAFYVIILVIGLALLSRSRQGELQ